MSAIDRRRFLLLAGMAGLAACSDNGESDATSSSTTATPGSSTTVPAGGESFELLAPPGTPGLMDEAAYQARVDDYLTYATATDDPSNPTGIGVHLIQAHRDPSYTWDIDAVTVDSLLDTWDQIDAWKDTRDFRFMYLNWMLALGQGDTPMTQLDPAVIAAIEERTLANRYRYNDPLPDDRIDHLWYWSENHRIITLANERLAGEFFPDATFAVTGMTGAEHAERAKPDILEWIDERARFGFFEWHSNVYMVKNVTPLLMLIELSTDPELIEAGALALDLALFDMASHYHRGAYVAPHGRTYKKDKMTAVDEDTFGTAKLLFDRTDQPYQSATDTGATYFGAAERYRPPQLVIDVAQDEQTSVTRERHGVFVDASAPLSENPEAPFGYDFDDPANIPFWWSTGGIGMWQLARVSVAEADEYRLWEGDVFQPITQLRDVNDGDIEQIRAWEQANYMILNFGFLAEGNTYAWRSPQVGLASVVDHRKGEMRDQGQAWQATIDPYARVFTTHPMTDADAVDRVEGRPRPRVLDRRGLDAPLGPDRQHRRSTSTCPPTTRRRTPSWPSCSGTRTTPTPTSPRTTSTRCARWGTGPWAPRTAATSPSGRGASPAGGSTTRRSTPPTAWSSRSISRRWAGRTTHGSSRWAPTPTARSTNSWPRSQRRIRWWNATDDGIAVTWASPTNGELSFGWDEPFVVDGEEQELDRLPPPRLSVGSGRAAGHAVPPHRRRLGARPRLRHRHAPLHLTRPAPPPRRRRNLGNQPTHVRVVAQVSSREEGSAGQNSSTVISTEPSRVVKRAVVTGSASKRCASTVRYSTVWVPVAPSMSITPYPFRRRSV